MANYTAVEGYDKANGKFPNNLGNVALVDCNSLGIQIGRNLDGLADKIAAVNNTNVSQYAVLVHFIAQPFYK